MAKAILNYKTNKKQEDYVCLVQYIADKLSER